ncbi:MAG: DUF86 domain-containing protein [Candidatus Odinarchaeum yellowstonii]|uniref:DUF86 domain-containing protein n=1 Tax=Odinarchaeota yellowstonii (strain LCB_4) TaxID=1841599 RepID=A0AAF0D4L3_ODILC|nr:MAG: DUF86 domain-containing protein [Candidatus Odinarchaeum yellowstonii]
MNNSEKVYATIYCPQIIGEAVKNIPESIKANYPEIPWQEIAGMRDRLIHRYFTVDFEKVWQTIKKDIIDLEKIVSKILKELQYNKL